MRTFASDPSTDNDMSEDGARRHQVDEIVDAIAGRSYGADDNLYELDVLDSLKLFSLILQLEETFSISLVEDEINFDDYMSKARITARVRAAAEKP